MRLLSYSSEGQTCVHVFSRRCDFFDAIFPPICTSPHTLMIPHASKQEIRPVYHTIAMRKHQSYSHVHVCRPRKIPSKMQKYCVHVHFMRDGNNRCVYAHACVCMCAVASLHMCTWPNSLHAVDGLCERIFVALVCKDAHVCVCVCVCVCVHGSNVTLNACKLTTCMYMYVYLHYVHVMR